MEVVRVLEERFRGDAADVQAGTAQSGTLFNANSFETELSGLKVRNSHLEKRNFENETSKKLQLSQCFKMKIQKLNFQSV